MASFYTAADALIERDGKYLIIQEGKERCRGTWNIPGGGVKHGENPVEAVKREVYEETGLEVEEVNGLITVCTGNSTKDGHPVIVFVFSVEVETGKPYPEFDEEILNAEFFTREEIKQLELRNDIMLKAIDSIDRSLPTESFRDYTHPYLDEEPGA